MRTKLCVLFLGWCFPFDALQRCGGRRVGKGHTGRARVMDILASAFGVAHVHVASRCWPYCK